jgi:hypothetical protein
LERWAPDPYEVLVVHNGTLTEASKTAVEMLKKASDKANISVTVADLSDPANAKVAQFHEKHSVDAPVAMHVLYPSHTRIPEPVWSGALSGETVKRLIDSPLRRKIVAQLIKGDSAVWVTVNSGDDSRDEAAHKALEAHLDAAGKHMKLPDGIVHVDGTTGGDVAPEAIDPENVLESTIPLKIAFSHLAVDRDDADEELFLAMLLSSESDLDEYAHEPISFPLFGRGRLLHALVGKGITEDNVLDSSAYLCGACSCQVKNENPGLDLLFQEDWDKHMEGGQVVVDRELPPLEGISTLIEKEEAKAGQVTGASGEEPAEGATESGIDKAPAAAAAVSESAQSTGKGANMGILLAIVFGVFVIIGVGGTLLVKKSD